MGLAKWSLNERSVSRVGRHADGSGVGNRHGDAVGVHHERDPQAHDELADRLDDALPLVVGLGPGQQVVRLPVTVGQAVQQHRRVVVLDPPVGVEHHRWAAAAVVEQLVDVEGRDDRRRVGREQMPGEHLLGLPGVDEPPERGHEDARVRVGRVGVVLESEQLLGVLHGSVLPGRHTGPDSGGLACTGGAGGHQPQRTSRTCPVSYTHLTLPTSDLV